MVLVCHKHDFIFLKTRKTAGTSIEMALETLCVPPGQEITEFRPKQLSEYGIVGSRGDDYKLKGFRRISRPWDWRNHRPASFVFRMLGKDEWNRRKKITAVRNPFDRMVSYYHYAAQFRPDAPKDFREIREDFRDFCYAGKWKTDRNIVFLRGKYIIDHAVRFEHMSDDLRSIAKTLGLPLDPDAIPVTKSMASTRKAHDVPDYYTKDVINHVRRRMSWVFDHYDYALDPQPKYQPA